MRAIRIQPANKLMSFKLYPRIVLQSTYWSFTTGRLINIRVQISIEVKPMLIVGCILGS